MPWNQQTSHKYQLTYKFQKFIRINAKEEVFKGRNARKADKAERITGSSNVLGSIVGGARGETRTPMGCPAGS
jgi:hypothetical protein